MNRTMFGRLLRPLFLILFIPLQLAMSSLECSTRTLKELYEGEEIEVTEILDVKLKNFKGLETVSRKKLFGTQDDLVIAIDNNAHVYDNLRTARHDGHHSRPGKVKIGTTVVEPGTYLRFTGLSDQRKDKLYAYLKSLEGQDLKQTSCIRSTCKVLEKGAGIKLKGGVPLIPSQILKKIIKNGFVDEKGNPVEYTLYRVQGKSMQETYDILKGREVNFYKKKKKELKAKSLYFLSVQGVIMAVVLEMPHDFKRE